MRELLHDADRRRRAESSGLDRGDDAPARRAKRMLGADVERKRDAAAAILAAEPMSVPATVEELKAELDEARAGGL